MALLIWSIEQVFLAHYIENSVNGGT